MISSGSHGVVGGCGRCDLPALPDYDTGSRHRHDPNSSGPNGHNQLGHSLVCSAIHAINQGFRSLDLATSLINYQNNSLAHTPHAVRHPSISLPASASHPGRHRCRTRRGRAKVALHEAPLPSLHLARAALSRIRARITRPCRPRKLHRSQQGLKEHAHVAVWLHTGST